MLRPANNGPDTDTPRIRIPLTYNWRYIKWQAHERLQQIWATIAMNSWILIS